MVRWNVPQRQRQEYSLCDQLFHLDWFGSIDGRS